MAVEKNVWFFAYSQKIKKMSLNNIFRNCFENHGVEIF